MGQRVVLAGRLGVEVDGQEWPVALASRQARLAFVVLVCERRRAVPADELAEVVWAGAVPVSWSASLRKVLSGVRSSLSAVGLTGAEALQAAFGCYQLHLPPGWSVDVEEAAEAVDLAEATWATGDATGAVAAAVAAVGVLRLPLLAGVDAPWLDAKRAELLGLHVRALEALARAQLTLGVNEGAVAAAGKAVALDPYRESSHRLVMAGHAAAGRRGSALRAYEACRRLLAEELGVSPSVEIESAYAQLLGPEDGPDVGPPRRISTAARNEPTDRAPDRVVERMGPLPARLASSPPAGFHGRSAELEAVADALKEAASGERRVVLVAGEAGIGKSALAAEVARAAHGAGATVLYGHCDEDLGFAYLPWVEALTQLVTHSPSELLSGLGPQRAHLARLVPAAVESLDDVAAAAPADPEAERYLLFGAVVAALRAAAADAPVVVVLDDLHWADKPTLMLLRHVIAAPERLPLLVLGTYRHHEVGGGHPLADILAALRREPGVQRMTLTGLSDLDLVAVMETAAGHRLGEPEVALAHVLHRESGGHPFFAWELLQHLVDTGAVSRAPNGAWVAESEGDERLPDSIREVIGRRVDRLGEQTRWILSLAAVIGLEFELTALATALGTDPDAVLDALDGAETAGLVATTSAGGYRFAHALVGHTLYQGLSATRRAVAHRLVAEALEDLGLADERVGELARHWAAATMSADVNKAVDYAGRAGKRALDDLAPAEALRWYRQALELWAQHPPGDEAVRCELLLGLGDAERQVGDPGFRSTLLEAAGVAQDLGDTDRLVRAALTNSRGAPQGLDPDRAAVVNAALDAVGEGDSAARARLLAAWAVHLTPSADHDRRTQAADQAVAVARRVGDPATLLAVLNDVAPAVDVPETLEERLALTAEAAALADVLGDPAAGFFAYMQRAQVALEAAELAEADRCLEKMTALAQQVGQPTLCWISGFHIGSRVLLGGDADEAERLAGEALQLGTETGQPDAFMIYGGQLVCIRWHQGRDAELIDLIAGVAANSPDLPVLRAGLSRLLLDAGRSDEVVVDLAELRSIPYNIAWAVAVARWAEVAAGLRALDACAYLYRALLPYPGQFLQLHAVAVGPVAHYLGLLAGALGDHDAAEAHFGEAEAICHGLRAPFHLARTHVAWGRLHLDRAGPGDQERGQELLRSALSTARAHGCGAVERQAAQALDLVLPSGSG